MYNNSNFWSGISNDNPKCKYYNLITSWHLNILNLIIRREFGRVADSFQLIFCIHDYSVKNPWSTSKILCSSVTCVPCASPLTDYNMLQVINQGLKKRKKKKKKEKVNVCTLLGVPSHQTVLGAIIVLVEKD